MKNWKDFVGFGLTSTLLLAASIGVAEAANNCAPREMVLERLANKFGESRQSVGLGAHNMVVETFASADTGSWTITVTRPDGMTCLVASGQSYETVAETAQTGDKA